MTLNFVRFFLKAQDDTSITGDYVELWINFNLIKRVFETFWSWVSSIFVVILSIVSLLLALSISNSFDVGVSFKLALATS